VEGKCEDTLRDPANLPEKICLLRLDTDWYESTKAEIEVLYPLIEPGGILIVDDRRCGTCEVVDLVDLDLERKGDVVAQELEPCVIAQMFNVPLAACEEIVDTDDVVTLRNQPVDQMGTEESGAAGYQYALAVRGTAHYRAYALAGC
jgi:hypothetical protein